MGTRFHLLTAFAVGALCWIVLMVGHEVVGHGGACVSLGGDALYVDAMYFKCSELTPLWKDQLYRAAGSLLNLLIAVVCWLSLRKLRRPTGWLGYFLWVSVLINLLQAGSYVAFGRFIHPGMDWPMIIQAGAPGPWAELTLAAGFLLLVLALWFGIAWIPKFIFDSGSLWVQKLRLILPPYLAAAAVSITASALVPGDDRMMMLMGGIGNSVGFLFPILFILLVPVKPKGTASPCFGASGGILTLALLTVMVYLLVIAPGIG